MDNIINWNIWVEFNGVDQGKKLKWWVELIWFKKSVLIDIFMEWRMQNSQTGKLVQDLCSPITLEINWYCCIWARGEREKYWNAKYNKYVIDWGTFPSGPLLYCLYYGLFDKMWAWFETSALKFICSFWLLLV